MNRLPFSSVVVVTLFAQIFVWADDPSYGVDVSWPVHHPAVSTNYPWLPHNMDPSVEIPSEFQDMVLQPLGNVQARYEKFMTDCYKYYEDKKEGDGMLCVEEEKDRIHSLLLQPRSMRNYTEVGYSLTRIPDHLFAILSEFWENNGPSKIKEEWNEGETYANHWESPTYLVDVHEDEDHPGAGFQIMQHIVNAVKNEVELWTEQRQVETSIYGIRQYSKGSMLSPHLGRLPLVTSAILCVDQQVDEPWPLEVIGRDGMAKNITMKSGDLLLYESHSIITGRPFPLKGNYVADIYVHFEPSGPIHGELEVDGDLPPYIIPGSEWETEWRDEYPDGHDLSGILDEETLTGPTEAHELARDNMISELIEFLEEYEDAILSRDENGYTPLAEAVHAGHEDVVKLLLDRGSDFNHRIGDEKQGGSLLWLAKEVHGENHKVVELLKARGGREITPDDDEPEL